MNPNQENESEDFAESLRDGLERLARRSPPGPRAVDVLASLSRRRRRRVIASIGAVLILAGTMVLWMAPGGPPDQSAGKGAVPELVEAPRKAASVAEPPPPAPLDPRAGAREIRDTLGAMFESLEVRNLLVEKEPGEAISFVIAGPTAARSDRFRGDLDRLLVNYRSARIEILDGQLSYSLMR